jgi:hypothetical protein
MHQHACTFLPRNITICKADHLEKRWCYAVPGYRIDIRGVPLSEQKSFPIWKGGPRPRFARSCTHVWQWIIVQRKKSKTNLEFIGKN